jgi:hypothetical protein
LSAASIRSEKRSCIALRFAQPAGGRPLLARLHLGIEQLAQIALVRPAFVA